MALLHVFFVAHGDPDHGDARAAREDMDEHIRRVMRGSGTDGTYEATTLQSTFQFSKIDSTRYTEDASLFCIEKGGRLMNLNTKTKAAIFDANSNAYRWIGAKKKSSKAAFKWNTGENVEPSHLTWKVHTSPCLYAIAQSTKDVWKRSCDQKYPFVCEYDRWVMPLSGFTTARSSTSLIVIPESLTYEQAEAKCKALFVGGRLATPSTFRELDAIDVLKKKKGDGNYWLGARRSKTGHNGGSWNNGFEIVANLREFVADNGGKCMIYNADKKFDFLGCDDKPKGFVCQFEK